MWSWNFFIQQIQIHSSTISSMFSMMSFSMFSFLNVTITNAFTGNSNTLSSTANNRWMFSINPHHHRSTIPKSDFLDPSKCPAPLFVFKIILFCLAFHFVLDVNRNLRMIRQIDFLFPAFIDERLSFASKQFNQQIQMNFFCNLWTMFHFFKILLNPRIMIMQRIKKSSKKKTIIHRHFLLRRLRLLPNV